MEKTIKQTRAKHLLAPEKEIKRNIDLFISQNPSAAIYLDQHKNKSTFSLTKLKELNLIFTENGKHRTLYSPTGALEQTNEWVKDIPLEKINALYILGTGLGYEYEVLKPWLEEDEKRRLIFLEYDPEKLMCFLETKSAYEMLTHPQVRITYFKDLDDSVFNDLTWDNFRVHIDVYATRHYLKKHPELFESLKHKLHHDSAHKNRTFGEYLQGSTEIYKNIYKNLLEIPHSLNGQNLLGKFKDVPAIICGAGPSLKKNFKFLKKVKNKALIFAGGSALNALTAQGVVPNFGIGVDPNPEQFKRLEKTKTFEVPFFYKNRMHHNAFKMVSGPRLYMRGVGGYPVSEWVEEKLGISGEVIEGGHNVVNLAAELALNLGCNPIIFIGCDLAFTEHHVYSPGVEESDRKVDKNTPLSNEIKPITRKDINGRKVLTQWKWITESQWLSEFSQKHPEVKMINSTQGGIGIPGVPNIPLKEVLADKLDSTHRLKQRLESEIEAAKLSIPKEKVVATLKELRDSLKRCKEHINVLLHQSDSPQAIIADVELVEEEGYKAVLDTFDQIFKHLFLLKAQSKGMEVEYSRQRLNYLHDCAESNITILNDVLK
jgi:hypothetical protein